MKPLSSQQSIAKLVDHDIHMYNLKEFDIEIICW